MAEKHLVFLVHGMGVHKKDWSKPLKEKLVEESGKYAYFKKQGRKLTDRVHFEEIVYDSFFTDILSNWESNAQSAIEAAPTDAEKETVKDALDWIEESSSDKASFFWTHVVDAVLWRINPYVRHAIMTRVAKTIAEKIDAQLKNTFDRRFSIIAYSLGTSVAHDVIDALAKGDWQDAPQPYGFSGRDVRFSSIHMVANVSRLLEVPARPAHESRTRPGPAGDENSYSVHFYNYRHELDPFTWAKRFKPEWDESTYHAKVVNHIWQANVHDAVHYLESPIVHIPILRSLAQFKAVTLEEESKAIAEFSKIPEEMQEIVDEIRDLLEKAKEAMGESPDLLDFLKGAAVFGRGIDLIKKKIKDAGD